MRTYPLLAALTLGAGIAAGTMALGPVFAQSASPAPQQVRNEMSIGQVYDKLAAAGYTDIDKIERERNAFEVKARDKNGARVKLAVDPQTGDVIEPRRQERNRDGRVSDSSQAK